MHVSRYVEEAYAAKKWAFVSDYFRMEKVAEYGGIYFDTDVELMRNPSILLLDPAFFAFETCDAVHAGILGAIPHHKAILQCLKSFESTPFVKKDGSYNTSFTIVRRISRQLKLRFDLQRRGTGFEKQNSCILSQQADIGHV